MPRWLVPLRAPIGLAAWLMLLSPASAQDESHKREVARATDDAQKAQKSLRVADGFRVDLFAAEPLLANPVSFDIDEKGRFYVIETFRHSAGVTDTRGHMNWLDDDLKSRTVADRVAMFKKYSTPEQFAAYSKEEDRIRLIEDRDGDGKADHATIFADGFKLTETGLAAGVLASRGTVYFTCIPDLWMLKDTNGDGKADERKSLHNGYGVHVGFLGHDLHGLIFGPDGKLYFSIGDRGFNVKTFDGKTLAVIDTGSVLRCDRDGRNLEVVATGLRNPQELAFTENGDLFTVDNNSDGGDRARLVRILEGGDSGWRIGYQFIEQPNSRGIWNSEKMWHPAWDGQAAWIVPPLANFTDGPSGLAYYPGTGLNASQKGRFYISDFRGAANTSGIRSFAVKPKGASYELSEPEQFLRGFEVTDCGFGPDGALYATDWVQGWNKTGKGRIWKVTAPGMEKDAAVAETKRLIAADFSGLRHDNLVRHLSNPDMRVRLKAQFALAERIVAQRERLGREGVADAMADKEARGGVDALVRLAVEGKETLPRLHALWGLGQVSERRSADPQWLQPLRSLLKDADAEVRAQAAKLLAKHGACSVEDLAALLKDENPRVRLFAAMAIGSLQNADAVPAVARMLSTDDGRDPVLRHAGVMALLGISREPKRGTEALKNLATDESPNVRMAVLLTRRRLADPAIAASLEDADPAIVLEAARAISETPELSSALPKLAALAKRPGLSEPLARRVAAACEATADARGLVMLASRKDVPDNVRVEALNLLGKWAKPSHRHPITGLYREVGERPATAAAEALSASLPKVLADAPDRVRRSAARIAGDLGIKDAGPTLRSLANDAAKPADSRVEALKALDALKDAQVGDLAHALVVDQAPAVRVEATRLLSHIDADRALEAINTALEKGPVVEKQGAFATLAAMKTPKADALLTSWVEKLAAGQVAPEVRLDLAEAATTRGTPDLKLAAERYAAAIPKDDPLALYRDSLVGGDADRGRRVFREKAEVQCLRCHKVEGDGGEVGPDLTGLGTRKDRLYILESIVLPNKQIAQGFETTLLAKADGQVVSGIVKSEDAREVRLITAEGKLLTVPTSEIEERSRGNSAMPEDVIKSLSRSELRDLIEFLATTKSPPAGSR